MIELEPEEPAQPAALPTKPVTLKPRSIGAGTMGADYANRKANEPQADPEVPYEALEPNTPAGAHANGTRPAPVLHHFAADGSLPHSIEAEEYLLSCCLIDGPEVVRRANEAGITPASFFLPGHAVIFGVLQDLLLRRVPIDVAVLGEELKRTKQLDSVGGYAFLTRVSGSIPTTAQAGYFIETVAGLSARREILRRAVGLIEACRDPSLTVPDLLDKARLMESIRPAPQAPPPRGLMDFSIPAPDDATVLLGNRYLCRGDGMILASSSGMGKSSLCLQAAATWALGQKFFGVKPNGPLKSLVIQSEDSDGDIGEVALSLRTMMSLSQADADVVNQQVIVESDRTSRGPSFVARLKGLVSRHKPDLVWVNPLLAYLEGDINSAQDAGNFLRGGLNGLNPGLFGYVVVHHTAKPPTAKEAKDRKWSEVMYDMTGSAELTNWARAVASLRPVHEEGCFNLVFAKRGKRAGATITGEDAVAYEVVGTTVPVRHTSKMVVPPGRTDAIPAIFWERRKKGEGEEAPEGAAISGRGGSKPVHTMEPYWAIFKNLGAIDAEHAKGFRQLHREAASIRPLGNTAFTRLLDDAVEIGSVKMRTDVRGHPHYWRG